MKSQQVDRYTSAQSIGRTGWFGPHASEGYTLCLCLTFLEHRIDSETGNQTDWLINSEYQNQAKPSWRDRMKDRCKYWGRDGDEKKGEGKRERQESENRWVTEGQQLAKLTHIVCTVYIRLVDARQTGVTQLWFVSTFVCGYISMFMVMLLRASLCVSCLCFVCEIQRQG